MPAAVSYSSQPMGHLAAAAGGGSIGGPPIVGSVLPIRRAEELLVTLPGVLSAKIVASETGAVDEIHVLTTAEYTPKQTVRNIESALIAHLGMRVDHRKISVAASGQRTPPVGSPPVASPPAGAPPHAAAYPGFGGGSGSVAGGSGPAARPAGNATVEGEGRPSGASSEPAPASPKLVRERVIAAAGTEFRDLVREVDSTLASVVSPESTGRRIYFEDVEVRRSRSRGMACRVTLRKGDASYTGEAEGLEGERARVELAARAALKAIASAERGERVLGLDGVKLLDAFDRAFVFVGVTAQVGRERAMLTGSCEVRESPEQASVLAVLDATNRWIAHGRAG